MANDLNKFIGVDGAAMRRFIVADVDASKPDGSNAGDQCYCIDTTFLYVWDGVQWNKRSYAPGVLDVQFFDTPGSTTWTKPAAPENSRVYARVISGGCGGGSGPKYAAGTACVGGGGGPAGEKIEHTMLLSDLGATEPVVVGDGGAGGAKVTANSTAGNQGTKGSISSFGSKIITRTQVVASSAGGVLIAAGGSPPYGPASGVVANMEGSGGMAYNSLQPNGSNPYSPPSQPGGGGAGFSVGAVQDRYWLSGCCDDDGTNCYATITANNSGMFRSTDSAANWTGFYIGDYEFYRPGCSIACDDDGSVVIIGMQSSSLPGNWPALYPGGRLYLSTDSGVTFSEVRPGGADSQLDWRCLGMDADGSVIVAGVNGGRLYISINGGSSWTEMNPPGGSPTNRVWFTCAVSDDGQKILVAGTGRLWLTTDQGANWTEQTPAGASDKSWRGCSMSGDGSVMMAAVYGGRLYRYSGGSWAEETPGGASNFNWTNTKTNRTDGSVHLACINSGRIYKYSGGSWSEVYPPGGTAANKAWELLALGADGSFMLAGPNPGRLYKSTDTGANWSECFSTNAIGPCSRGQDGAKGLSCVTEGGRDGAAGEDSTDYDSGAGGGGGNTWGVGGGVGGKYGGGGGGGAPGRNTLEDSGAGGKGGKGCVLVVVYPADTGGAAPDSYFPIGF